MKLYKLIYTMNIELRYGGNKMINKRKYVNISGKKIFTVLFMFIVAVLFGIGVSAATSSCPPHDWDPSWNTYTKHISASYTYCDFDAIITVWRCRKCGGTEEYENQVSNKVYHTTESSTDSGDVRYCYFNVTRCTNCGYIVSKKGVSHDYQETGSGGPDQYYCSYTKYQCKSCGKTKTEHTAHSAPDDFESSCGYNSYTCTNCSANVSFYEDHDYRKVSDTQTSTRCYYEKCSKCGSTHDISHSWSYGSWSNYSTTQHKRIKTCTRCNYSGNDYAMHDKTYTYAEGNYSTHSWRCSSCGATGTEAHTRGSDNNCTKCGMLLKQIILNSASFHDYTVGDKIIKIEANAKFTGTSTYEFVVIATADGHSVSSGKVSIPADNITSAGDGTYDIVVVYTIPAEMAAYSQSMTLKLQLYGDGDTASNIIDVTRGTGNTDGGSGNTIIYDIDSPKMTLNTKPNHLGYITTNVLAKKVGYGLISANGSASVSGYGQYAVDNTNIYRTSINSGTPYNVRNVVVASNVNVTDLNGNKALSGLASDYFKIKDEYNGTTTEIKVFPTGMTADGYTWDNLMKYISDNGTVDLRSWLNSDEESLKPWTLYGCTPSRTQGLSGTSYETDAAITTDVGYLNSNKFPATSSGSYNIAFVLEGDGVHKITFVITDDYGHVTELTWEFNVVTQKPRLGYYNAGVFTEGIISYRSLDVASFNKRPVVTGDILLKRNGTDGIIDGKTSKGIDYNIENAKVYIECTDLITNEGDVSIIYSRGEKSGDTVISSESFIVPNSDKKILLNRNKDAGTTEVGLNLDMGIEAGKTVEKSVVVNVIDKFGNYSGYGYDDDAFRMDIMTTYVDTTSDADRHFIFDISNVTYKDTFKLNNSTNTEVWYVKDDVLYPTLKFESSEGIMKFKMSLIDGTYSPAATSNDHIYYTLGEDVTPTELSQFIGDGTKAQNDLTPYLSAGLTCNVESAVQQIVIDGTTWAGNRHYISFSRFTKPSASASVTANVFTSILDDDYVNDVDLRYAHPTYHTLSSVSSARTSRLSYLKGNANDLVIIRDATIPKATQLIMEECASTDSPEYVTNTKVAVRLKAEDIMDTVSNFYSGIRDVEIRWASTGGTDHYDATTVWTDWTSITNFNKYDMATKTESSEKVTINNSLNMTSTEKWGEYADFMGLKNLDETFVIDPGMRAGYFFVQIRVTDMAGNINDIDLDMSEIAGLPDSVTSIQRDANPPEITVTIMKDSNNIDYVHYNEWISTGMYPNPVIRVEVKEDSSAIRSIMVAVTDKNVRPADDSSEWVELLSFGGWGSLDPVAVGDMIRDYTFDIPLLSDTYHEYGTARTGDERKSLVYGQNYIFIRTQDLVLNSGEYSPSVEAVNNGETEADADKYRILVNSGLETKADSITKMYKDDTYSSSSVLKAKDYVAGMTVPYDSDYLGKYKIYGTNYTWTFGSISNTDYTSAVVPSGGNVLYMLHNLTNATADKQETYSIDYKLYELKGDSLRTSLQKTGSIIREYHNTIPSANVTQLTGNKLQIKDSIDLVMPDMWKIPDGTYACEITIKDNKDYIPTVDGVGGKDISSVRVDVVILIKNDSPMSPVITKASGGAVNCLFRIEDFANVAGLRAGYTKNVYIYNAGGTLTETRTLDSMTDTLSYVPTSSCKIVLEIKDFNGNVTRSQAVVNVAGSGGAGGGAGGAGGAGGTEYNIQGTVIETNGTYNVIVSNREKDNKEDATLIDNPFDFIK